MGEKILVENTISSSSEEKEPNSKRKAQHEIEKIIKSVDGRVKFIGKLKDGKSSPVWKLFQLIHIDGIRQDYVLCLSCKKVMRYVPINGTNGLKRHVKSCSKLMSSNDTSQSMITSHFTNRSNGSTKSSWIPKRFLTQMVNACAEYCALDGRAFESINGIGFQRMVKVVFDAGRACGSMKQSFITFLYHGLDVLIFED